MSTTLTPAPAPAPLASRLVDRIAARIGRRSGPDRRGFLRGAAVVGAAVATSPWGYLTRPASAYDAVCGADNLCGDGYSVFCCTINGGQNTCPPASFIGGWWKADNSSFCGGSARYYVDCNAFRPDSPWSCRCATGTCDQRKVACNQFRYGQCSPEIPYSATGPVLCRLVSCTPPWQQFAGTCSSSSATDNNTATHSAPCVGAAPLGSLDAISSTVNTVQVRGWAFDPDSPATAISVAVSIDGGALATFPTGRPRPDVAAAYGIPGDHGYELALEVPNGVHTLTVYALNVAGGFGNPLLGTRTVDVNPTSPRGYLDSFTASGNTVTVTGWAYEPDAPGASIEVWLGASSPGSGVGTGIVGRTTIVRDDVNAAYGLTGAHGFSLSISAVNGPHTFSLLARNTGGGTDTLLDNRTIEVNPGLAPVGSLDSATTVGGDVRVTGWAFDPDVPGTSIPVAVYSDTLGIGWFPADQPRDDVSAAYGIPGRHGYDVTFSAAPGVHSITVFGIQAGGGSTNPVIGSRSVAVGPTGSLGSLDEATATGRLVRLRGWAVDREHPGDPVGIEVRVDGSRLRRATTTVVREDVNAAYAVTGAHGFDLQVRLSPGTRTVTVLALGGPGDRPVLGSRTVAVGAP